ncbi:MAG TPA: hypothetical protein VIM73_00320, partial [Polyangiaceae bacterium]
VTSGSSLDRHSNNVTLFNLVEQLNFPKDRLPPAGAVLPLEIHAYFQLDPHEINQRFDVRFSLVAPTGLETVTDAFAHKSVTARFRTRTMGLPIPPVPGAYDLRVDTRQAGTDAWRRDALVWPLVVAENEPRPAVTH